MNICGLLDGLTSAKAYVDSIWQKCAITYPLSKSPDSFSVICTLDGTCHTSLAWPDPIPRRGVIAFSISARFPSEVSQNVESPRSAEGRLTIKIL